MSLYLVRHAESTANASGLLVGRTDAMLSENGRGQAAALGPVLADLLGPSIHKARVISSPLSRAIETASIALPGVEPDLDERWVEIDYGDYEGRELVSFDRGSWMAWRSDPAFTPPGGESLEVLYTRVSCACAELFDAAGKAPPGDPVVVFSHVSPIKAAVAWALGVGVAVAWRMHLSTASITSITFGREAPQLEQYNLDVASWSSCS